MNKQSCRSGAFILALSFATVSPVFAQAITKENGAGTGKEQGAQPNQAPTGQTGVPPRGTEVAPTTTPGQPHQPATGQTGAGPRGTEVGPSTNPGQQKQ
jgi:hypothetical protein